MERDDRDGQGEPDQGDERDGRAADAERPGADERAGVVVPPDVPPDVPPEDPTHPDLAPPSAPMLGRVPPVNRAMARVGRRFGGRPIAVYSVLAAGGAILLILLLIVWFSAGDDGDDDAIPCFDAQRGEAVSLVKDGQVEGVTILSPQPDDEEIDADLVLPTLLTIKLVDGTCRNLQPQGPQGEIEMYTVLGVVDWYNHKTGQRRIEVDISESDSIPAAILATVTPTPAPTVPMTETPVDPATPVVETPVPTATATVEPTVTPPPPIVGVGSPAASPVASPGV